MTKLAEMKRVVVTTTSEEPTPFPWRCDEQWVFQRLGKVGLRPRKLLDDDDVAGILADVKEVGLRRREPMKRGRPRSGKDVFSGVNVEKLKHDLNRAVHHANVYMGLFVAPPLHEWIKRIEKVRRAIEKARKLLNESEDIRTALALELDGYPNRHLHELPDATLKEWQATRITLLQHMSALSVPSEEAVAQVAQLTTGVDLLADWMAKLTLSERKRKQEKRPDYCRFGLILELERLFKSTFGQPATKTLDGACCRFLAAVLRRCEGRRIGRAGVLDSWRDAERWREELGHLRTLRIASKKICNP